MISPFYDENFTRQTYRHLENRDSSSLGTTCRMLNQFYLNYGDISSTLSSNSENPKMVHLLLQNNQHPQLSTLRKIIKLALEFENYTLISYLTGKEKNDRINKTYFFKACQWNWIYPFRIKVTQTQMNSKPRYSPICLGPILINMGAK